MKITRRLADDDLSANAVNQNLDVLGPQWAAMALNSLRAEPFQSISEEQDLPSDLWVSPGYINFQTWDMELMRLTPKGSANEQGHQRLEVSDLFVNPSPVYFAKLLHDAAFELQWDVETLGLKF